MSRIVLCKCFIGGRGGGRPLSFFNLERRQLGVSEVLRQYGLAKLVLWAGGMCRGDCRSAQVEPWRVFS